jgi:isopentenyl diphosphate isomerase/L-lactate dehydrogenase-like FMN-dependent dehydrogenase
MAYDYYASGADDEVTLGDNAAAWRRIRLRPKCLVDVSACDLATTALGTPVSMPVLVAPTAMQRFAHDEAERATARAATAAGTVQILSSVSTVKPRVVADAAPGGKRWFQVYVFTDRGVTRALIDEAVEAGYRALVLTVDVPHLGRRERDLRAAFEIPAEFEVPDLGGIEPALTWRDLEWIRSETQLPLAVKGILTREDALLAVEHGADAVWVSNHGGRQLDHVAAGLDALPEVVEAVAGRAEVYVDGGIRRGTDVLKALALGARAAFAGRAFACGLAVDGERGVERVLSLLRDEIQLGLGLLGCTSPDSVSRGHVEPVVPYDPVA